MVKKCVLKIIFSDFTDKQEFAGKDIMYESNRIRYVWSNSKTDRR